MTRKTALRLGAVAALAVLLSSCIKLDMSLDVSTNNTVSGTVILAVDKQLLELTGQSVGDLLSGSGSSLPTDLPGVTTEPYEDDTFAGQQITFDSVSLDQFNSSGGADSLQILREGDQFVATGTLDMSGATGLSGVTGATGTGGLPSGFPGASEMFESAEIEISISFPGEVISSNGEVDGNTVTWSPEFGEQLELQATASAIGGDGESSFPWIWIVVAAVAVIVAAILVLVLGRRRKGKKAAAAVEGVPTAPMAPTAPTEPAAPAAAPTEPAPTEPAPTEMPPAPTEVPPAPPTEMPPPPPPPTA